MKIPLPRPWTGFGPWPIARRGLFQSIQSPQLIIRRSPPELPLISTQVL
jgi:hypothetical protein